MLKVYVGICIYFIYLGDIIKVSLNTGPTTGNSRKIPNTFVTVDREIQ